MNKTGAAAAACDERDEFENRYYQGLYEDTETAREYAGTLHRYKQAISQRQNIEKSKRGKSKAEIRREKKAARSKLWLIPLFFMYLPFFSYLFSGGRITVLLFFVILDVVLWVVIIKKEKVRSSSRKDAQNPKPIQDRLTSLIPGMRKDLANWQAEWFERNRDVLTEQDFRNYEGEDFPAAFWWQMPLEEVEKMDAVFDCNKYGRWESRITVKDSGKEFNAAGDLSPIVPTDADGYRRQMDYFRSCGSSMKVLDVISQLTEIVGSRSETVNYEVPAHSSLEIFARRMGTYALAKGIDRSYNSGMLSEREYRDQAMGIGMLTYMNESYADETKEEIYTEYIPVKKFSYMWTGQFILQKLSDEGTDSVIIQYFCQPQHLVENLNTLKMYDLNVVSINIDWHNNIPYFLTKFFMLYPEAY